MTVIEFKRKRQSRNRILYITRALAQLGKKIGRNYENYFLPLIIMFFLGMEGCDSSITEENNKDLFYEGETFFNGTTNGDKWLGGGNAFYDEDSSLHIRGIYGHLTDYNQFDILIENLEENTFSLDSGKAGMSIIIGGDAVEKSYTNIGRQSYSITYYWNKMEGYLNGKFSFMGLDHNSNNLSFSGKFKIHSANEGTDWKISLDENGNLTCSFIK